MPRSKTVQPKPLEEFLLDDGTVVEVRDWSTRLIGRGLDKRFVADETDWQVLTGLVDDLSSGDPARVLRAKSALSSNRAMDRYLNAGGYDYDERTGRSHGASIRAKFKQLNLIAGIVEYDSWQVHPSPPPTGILAIRLEASNTMEPSDVRPANKDRY